MLEKPTLKSWFLYIFGMKKIHKIGWILALVLIVILLYFIFFYSSTLGNDFCDSYCKSTYTKADYVTGRCYLKLETKYQTFKSEPTLACGFQYCACSIIMSLIIN